MHQEMNQAKMSQEILRKNQKAGKRKIHKIMMKNRKIQKSILIQIKHRILNLKNQIKKVKNKKIQLKIRNQTKHLNQKNQRRRKQKKKQRKKKKNVLKRNQKIQKQKK